ncbi:MAG: hypothetical protein CMM50_06100 [Rhodospirillaceae bacterium]|nr:hypothetical protein [Rhodospirillaceae bacterium]
MERSALLGHSLWMAVVLSAFFLAQAAIAENATDREVNDMKIRIVVEGMAVTATLEDNQTARDFVALLPFATMLEDYASTEKIAGLPRRLNTDNAPAGIDPSVGDITYYAPWGNLAVFYRDFSYARGLVKLGSIDSGIEVLDRPGPMQATIELIDK